MPGRQAGDARVEPDPRAVAGRSGLVLHRGPPVRYALERKAGRPRGGGGPRNLRGPVRRAAVGPYQAERLQPRLFLPGRLGWHVQYLLVSGDPAHRRLQRARAELDEDVRSVVQDLAQLLREPLRLLSLLDHAVRDDPTGPPPGREFLGLGVRSSRYEQRDVRGAGGGVVVRGQPGVGGAGGEAVEGLSEFVGGAGRDDGAVREGSAGLRGGPRQVRQRNGARGQVGGQPRGGGGQGTGGVGGQGDDDGGARGGALRVGGGGGGTARGTRGSGDWGGTG